MGVVTVVNPPEMLARVHLASLEPGVIAPIVVTFETSNSPRYRLAVGPMRLKVVFSQPLKIVPALANGSLLSDLSVIGDGGVNGMLYGEAATPDEASQVACST